MKPKLTLCIVFGLLALAGPAQSGFPSSGKYKPGSATNFLLAANGSVLLISPDPNLLVNTGVNLLANTGSIVLVNNNAPRFLIQ